MKISTDLKVGIFALVVLAILSFMTFKVGGLEWLKKEGYTVYVTFKDIAGLDRKSRIRVAGVDAGIIEDITLEDGKARLTLRMNPSVKLYSDACATIKTVGLLGEKYLEVGVGSKAPLLRQGDSIRNVKETVDMDDLVRTLSEFSESASTFMENVNEVMSDEQIETLKESLAALRDMARNANTMVVENDRRFRQTLDRMNSFLIRIDNFVRANEGSATELVANLRDFSDALKKETPVLMSDMKETSGEVRSFVAETRHGMQSIVNSMEAVAKNLEEGKGTLGKLLKDEELYQRVNTAAASVSNTVGAITRFRTFLDFQGNYLVEPGETKGRFLLALKPRPDKYYILGVTTDPVARVDTDEKVVDGVTIKEEDIDQEIEFTAQIAKRFTDNMTFKDTALRIGVTESTFGVGADQFFMNDRMKLSLDAWDFGSDEEDSKNPHVNVGLDYFLFKHVYLSAGIDNIFNSRWRGPYVGGGIRFEDEDFKYLLGTAPKLR
jgi:phospholipid/cholesterol/gamma-HCH transport system substrate-binding protein